MTSCIRDDIRRRSAMRPSISMWSRCNACETPQRQRQRSGTRVGLVNRTARKKTRTRRWTWWKHCHEALWWLRKSLESGVRAWLFGKILSFFLTLSMKMRLAGSVQRLRYVHRLLPARRSISDVSRAIYKREPCSGPFHQGTGTRQVSPIRTALIIHRRTAVICNQFTWSSLSWTSDQLCISL